VLALTVGACGPTVVESSGSIAPPAEPETSTAVESDPTPDPQPSEAPSPQPTAPATVEAEPDEIAAPTGTPAPTPTQTPAPTESPAAANGGEPTAEPQTSPDPTPTPAPTALPEPTPDPTPDPAATDVPLTAIELPPVTFTPVPATGPVLLEGDGWTIQQSEFDQIVAFVEEVHQLEFLGPVGFRTEPDIGAAFAAGFEIFSDDDWRLLQALNLGGGFDRETVNQLRRDRIRGVCCETRETTQVIVEPNPTKLETMTILVHELVHALHTQRPDLFEDLPPPSNEIPFTFAAALEGVPQYVAFAYFSLAPQDEQDIVEPDLPIIRDDMVPSIGDGAARYINFAYSAGPAFVSRVVEARGTVGLSELIRNPPTSTEQVLYPDKYMSGQMAEPVDTPARDGRLVESRGRLGVAMIIFALGADVDSQAALDLLDGWAGDAYFTHIARGRACVAATVQMDTSGQAAALATALANRPGVDAVSVDGPTIQFESCQTSGTAG